MLAKKCVLLLYVCLPLIPLGGIEMNGLNTTEVFAKRKYCYDNNLNNYLAAKY